MFRSAFHFLDVPENQYPATSRTNVLENIQRSMSSMADRMKALLQNEDNCDYDRGVNNLVYSKNAMDTQLEQGLYLKVTQF